jgi:hypothetical protein
VHHDARSQWTVELGRWCGHRRRCQSPTYGQSYSGPSRRRRPGNRDQARGCNGESPGPVGPAGPPGRLTDRSAAAGPGACTAPAGPPGHHQATHVVASRCDARPAVTRTRTGGAAADRLTVGLPGRVRRRVGPARKDSESGVPARRLQRPPRPLQRRSHRRRRAALLRSTVVVTGHGHGRTHFVERSPSHGRAAAAESPSRTAAPAAVSDPAAG